MALPPVLKRALLDNLTPEEQTIQQEACGGRSCPVITEEEIRHITSQIPEKVLANFIRSAGKNYKVTTNAWKYIQTLNLAPAISQTILEFPSIRNFCKDPNPENLSRVFDDLDQLLPQLPQGWEDPRGLNPSLSLKILNENSQTFEFELVSHLRLLAILEGRLKDPRFSPEMAQIFLSRVLEFNNTGIGPVGHGHSQFIQRLIKLTETELSQFHLSRQANAPETFEVAAIQLDSGFNDTKKKVEDNIKRMASLIEQAATHGAKFIVTPEAAVQGYANVNFHTPPNNLNNPQYEGYFFNNGVGKMWCHDSRNAGCSAGKVERSLPRPGRPIEFVNVATVALNKDAKELQVFSDIAKKYETYVAIGYIEKEGNGNNQKIFNSVNIYGPDGKIAYHYRKHHLWKVVDDNVFTEAKLSEKPYFDTPYGRFSAAICFAGNFIFSELKPYQVDTLLYSVAWVSGGPESFNSLNHSMIGGKVLMENPMHVVMANWVWPDTLETRETAPGANAELWGSGLSYVMDNHGSLLNMAQDNDPHGILYARLPLPGKNSRGH